MKSLAFSIYDEKAESYGQPFFVNAIGIASRHFSDTVNNSETMIAQHPEDFSLYHIGYFDTENGKLDANDVPVLIGRGPDYKPKTETKIREVKNG